MHFHNIFPSLLFIYIYIWYDMMMMIWYRYDACGQRKWCAHSLTWKAKVFFTLKIVAFLFFSFLVNDRSFVRSFAVEVVIWKIKVVKLKKLWVWSIWCFVSFPSVWSADNNGERFVEIMVYLQWLRHMVTA